jgi:hypothetical protein
MIQHSTVLALCLLVGVSVAGCVNAGIRGSKRDAFVFFSMLVSTALMGFVMNSGMWPERAQAGLERLLIIFWYSTAILILCISVVVSGRREFVRDLGVCVISAATAYYIVWM